MSASPKPQPSNSFLILIAFEPRLTLCFLGAGVAPIAAVAGLELVVVVMECVRLSGFTAEGEHIGVVRGCEEMAETSRATS